MHDPNGKVLLSPLNPRGERHLQAPEDGNAAGFRRPYRRPRTPMTTDCMPIERADRVEEFDREMREVMQDYDD